MPYVITTTQTIFDWPSESVEARRVKNETLRRGYTTRVAVATLDEARDYVATSIESSPAWIGTTHPFNGLDGLVSAAGRLPESGGTIGPLPDGTIIEVSRVGLRELADQSGIASDVYGRDILAAFNAS